MWNIRKTKSIFLFNIFIKFNELSHTITRMLTTYVKNVEAKWENQFSERLESWKKFFLCCTENVWRMEKKSGSLWNI